MRIKKRKTLGIFFSLMFMVSAAALLTAPRSHALEAAQATGNQFGVTPLTALPTARQSPGITSTNRHTACKRSCEEKYSSCVASKKAKGWSDDRAEKTCGLTARTCKGGCDRR
jgi:hypothetical protein